MAAIVRAHPPPAARLLPLHSHTTLSLSLTQLASASGGGHAVRGAGALCVWGEGERFFFDGAPPDKGSPPRMPRCGCPLLCPLGWYMRARTRCAKRGAVRLAVERGDAWPFFSSPPLLHPPSCTPVSPVASASAAAPLTSPWACR